MERAAVRRWRWRSIAATMATASLVSLAGCSIPVLTRDGQLVFQPKGAHGASVITANGVEFLDRAEIPQPFVRRSPDEPWRPATGFLMPSDGIWRKSSTPVPVQGPGLAVVLRSSDVLIPSWGGEILLRLDAIAPVAAFPRAASSVRPPERLVVILDGDGADTLALADDLLENLGGADRVGVIDATSARPVLPLVPASHRTLLHGAVERLLAQGPRARSHEPSARDLAGALALARGWVSLEAPIAPIPPPSTAGEAEATRHILVLTDGGGLLRGGARLQQELDQLSTAGAGVRVSAVATDWLEAAALAPLGAGALVVVRGSLAERKDAIDHAVPPPGEIVLDDVTLSLSSVPAPARMIEVSGGQSALGLYADHLSLGELYAGEARTEVARVVLPPWVPGEPLELTLTARYRDVASGRDQEAHATLRCRYSADVEEIANARHGDVIAYASGLAMVRRLHRAFLGGRVERLGGIRQLVGLQARSLAVMAREQADPAAGVQAEILSTLLGVIED